MSKTTEDINLNSGATNPNHNEIPRNMRGEAVPTGPISYEAFLNWADEDTRAEWVEGEIELSSPASFRHQNIVRFLIEVIGGFNEFRDLGVILPAPFQMKLESSGREPDLLFLRQEHLNRLRATYIDGPADLVVEIISPESNLRDRQVKFQQYAAGGVAEYWLIDPVGQEAIFYRLNSTTGQYETNQLDEQGRYYAQEIAGFWLEPAWLWQQPLPQVQTVLFTVGGAAYLQYVLEKAKQAGL